MSSSLSKADHPERAICPCQVFGESSATPGFARRMAVTEGEVTNGSDRIEKSYAFAVDLDPGRRLIHRESAIQHRLFGGLKNHVSEIVVAVPIRRTSIVENTAQP